MERRLANGGIELLIDLHQSISQSLMSMLWTEKNLHEIVSLRAHKSTCFQHIQSILYCGITVIRKNLINHRKKKGHLVFLKVIESSKTATNIHNSTKESNTSCYLAGERKITFTCLLILFTSVAVTKTASTPLHSHCCILIATCACE